MSTFKAALRLTAAFLMAATYTAAQTSTSQLSGTVRDASGAVVAGAQVTLTNDATGVVQRQNTTNARVYVFPAINVGSYSVKVESAGFKSFTRSANTVQINTPIVVDVALEVGASSESVSVVASAA